MIRWKPSLSINAYWLLLWVMLACGVYLGVVVYDLNRDTSRDPIAEIIVPAEMAIGEGGTCTAVASRDPNNERLTFQWDLNGDGIWDRETKTGILEVSFWDDLEPLGYWHDDVVVVSVRVTNSSGLSSVAQGKITIINRKRKEQEQSRLHQPLR